MLGSDLQEWVANQLSSLLHFPATEDHAKCILMIESPRDLEEYMSTLVDMKNPLHAKFVKELISKKQLTQGYKKSELDDYVFIGGQEKKEKKKGVKSKNDKKSTANTTSNNSTNDNDKSQEKTNKKKKPHYVNMYSDEANRTVLLTGRHICECQATKHKLVSNCLSCGRIVCEQEGAGPCLFCSNVVQPRGAQPQGGRNDAALDSALELRDKLLEYDKSSERRTKVIDDENDYFSTNSVWLSKEQKEALKKKEEQLQALKHSRARNILIDFTGRCILDDDFKKLNEEASLLDDVTEIMRDVDVTGALENDNIDPKSTLDIEPVYSCSSIDKPATGSRWHNSFGKVQDKQVMEMSDIGVCLSMHQPWATLLIAGIKRHEGRSWYTAHRGRLWIASAAKQPTPEEIEEVKNQYRMIRGDSTKFPSKYPVGCLLGCVNLVDCLAQEEYREVYPEGESDSPFVFICEDPTPCPVLFPMKGKHKIYKMESKIHQAAAKCIQKLSVN